MSDIKSSAKLSTVIGINFQITDQYFKIFVESFDRDEWMTRGLWNRNLTVVRKGHFKDTSHHA